MKKSIASLAYACLMVAAATPAIAQNVAVIDNTTVSGLQGVVYFNSALQVQTTFTTANTLNGIAFAGSSNLDVYASTSAGVSLFDSSGNVLANYDNIGADSFGSVAVDKSGNVFAADNTTISGLQGIVEFNSALQVLNTFLFASPITGLSVGPAGSLYLSTAQSANQTDLSGTVLNSYSGFSADSFLGASFNGTSVYVADNTTISGLQGVIEFNPTLSSYTSFLTPNPITGLAADASGKVYTSQGINVIAYASDGTQVAAYNGFGADSFYGVAVQPSVSTPAPSAVLMFAAPLVGLLRRRKLA